MHDSVYEFVTTAVKTHGLTGKVLEVGALDINGTVRDLFGSDYIGIDKTPGPGVDRLATRGFYETHQEHFDVVVSTEMLEHDRFPWVTFGFMCQALRVGGHLVLTCRGYTDSEVYGPHDYPADYWRFSPAGIHQLCRFVGLTVLECVLDPQAPGVFLVAQR